MDGRFVIDGVADGRSVGVGEGIDVEEVNIKTGCDEEVVGVERKPASFGITIDFIHFSHTRLKQIVLQKWP